MPVAEQTEAVGEQFYVTHCTKSDSVMDAPGYNVRAASVGDSEVLKRALEYPPYELPLDMWREKPTKPQTPRRLARTRAPGGGMWAVHSVYLDKDTMGRDRSYFTHIVQFPTVDVASVLESWDSADWATEYPLGATKRLERRTLPKGKRIGPNTLAAFLSDKTIGGPGEALAVVVCPGKGKPESRPDYRADPAARRKLVERFLKAVMLVKAAEVDGDRARLYVHAEPGLTALLLYAAARVLPPHFTRDLTFSTFEPNHRSIRDYELATVVGTYLGLPGKGLDQDLGRTHGYAIDTFVPDRSSPELAENIPPVPGLSHLIELAAAGKWDILEGIHRLLAAEPDSLEKVPGLIPLVGAVTRLKRREPTTEDLLALKADPRGAGALRDPELVDAVWAYLKDAAVGDPKLRAAFRAELADPERIREYRHDACKALAKGEFDVWDERWGVVRDVLSNNRGELLTQTEKALKGLDEHLPTLSMAARDRLRRACAESGAWPDHHLLAPASADELKILLAKDAPADWRGYTCFAIIGPDEENWLHKSTERARPVMREQVKRYLLAADGEVLKSYALHAAKYVSKSPVFLRDLIEPYSPAGRAFLSRLIRAGADRIGAGDWVALLGDLNIYGTPSDEDPEPKWGNFLLENTNLADLLAGFKDDENARTVWKPYIGFLSGELFTGDDWETKLYAQLTKAWRALEAEGVELKAAAGESSARKLTSAAALMGVLADPATAGSLPDESLLRAFSSFDIEPLVGLKTIFAKGGPDKGGYADLDPKDGIDQYRPFLIAFQACYPVRDDPFDDATQARGACAQLLNLTAELPREKKVALQVMFVESCIPPKYRDQLLNDSRRFPFDPTAEAHLRNRLKSGKSLAPVAAAPAAAPKKGGGGTYAKPSKQSDSDEDSGYASEATKRHKKSKSGGKKKGGGGIPIVVWVVGGIVVVCLVAWAAFSMFGKKPEKPKEPDTPPPVVKPDDKAKDKDDKTKKKT